MTRRMRLALTAVNCVLWMSVYEKKPEITGVPVRKFWAFITRKPAWEANALCDVHRGACARVADRVAFRFVLPQAVPPTSMTSKLQANVLLLSYS